MAGADPTFDFMLAERLHMTVAEVRRMSNGEYEEWRAYLHVKGTLEDLARRTGQHR